MIESGYAIIVAPSLRRRVLIRSGPQALFILRFRRTFLTSSTDQTGSKLIQIHITFTY